MKDKDITNKPKRKELTRVILIYDEDKAVLDTLGKKSDTYADIIHSLIQDRS
jgi:hypothetical protein